MKKCIFTLDIGNYAPEIKHFTRPWLLRYAKKIGAEFRIISERKWPDLPLMHEKLQLHELGREYDWNIYIDSDALVHPDFMDLTELLPMDTIVHYGFDFAPNRFKSDEYFRRDGRAIGSCGWLSIASRDCLDLWHPLEDLTVEQAVSNIFPTTNERNVTMDPAHLMDDYVVSRNIARYGLKALTVPQVLGKYGHGTEQYLWHEYTLTTAKKVETCIKMLYIWGLWKEAGLPEPPKAPEKEP